MSATGETAFAKINLALHVRGRLPDGRHDIETVFAFCEEGDQLSAEPCETLSLTVTGPFAAELEGCDNLILDAAMKLRSDAGIQDGAALRLDKRLPVASGLGGGSADAAAALRLLGRLWDVDPAFAEAIAPGLGSDVPACLASRTARGEGGGDQLEPAELNLSGTPLLLVNPRVQLSTGAVFERWDGVDHGPLTDWRLGRNDLEPAAVALVPQIFAVLAWLSAQPGADFVRMSGSGATCFALFESDALRDQAAQAVPREWWHLATRLR